MKNFKEIHDFIRANTYFDSYEADEDSIVFTTRANGNVGDETFGEKDYNEALKIKKLLLAKFDNIEVEVEDIDEWVHLNISKK